MWLTELEITTGNLVAATKVLHEELPRFPGETGNFVIKRTRIQVRLWLALGNLVEAHAWAEQVVFRHMDTYPIQIHEVMAQILVSFAGQHYDQALAIMEAFRAYLDRPGNIEHTISFLSFYATALHQAGKHAQAREAVLRLLSLTEPEGHLRVYLDMGEPMQHLLQSLLDPSMDQENGSAPIPGAYVAMLLAVFEQDAQKRAAQSDGSPSHRAQKNQASRPTHLSDSVPGLLETLTQQELRVLRLLAAGCSNQDIAQELVVSPNTVKTHVKNLYSKLQVSSRTQALALARDLQLL